MYRDLANSRLGAKSTPILAQARLLHARATCASGTALATGREERPRAMTLPEPPLFGRTYVPHRFETSPLPGAPQESPVSSPVAARTASPFREPIEPACPDPPGCPSRHSLYTAVLNRHRTSPNHSRTVCASRRTRRCQRPLTGRNHRDWRHRGATRARVAR